MKVSVGTRLSASETGVVEVREIDARADGSVTLLCAAADGALITIEAEIALPRQLTPAPKRLYSRAPLVASGLGRPAA